MVARVRRRAIGSDNTWPGFVDALSTMLLVIIFLLSMFVLAQFFLGQALSGRDEALSKLEVQIAGLGSLLELEQRANSELRLNIGQLSVSLQNANMDRDEMSGRISNLEAEIADAEARMATAQRSGADTAERLARVQERYVLASDELQAERKLTREAQAEVDRLNRGIAALREQLARIEASLDASELRDKQQQAVISDLGSRLNVALAGKVEELAGYRSEFFGRLREVLGNRPDVRVEGDRFVFQSELLFASGSADLGADGRDELAAFASTLVRISGEIPEDVDWVLRVDGHTDKVPMASARYPSNWELSTARAISVVRYLVSQGVPPRRLAAAGFGEFQPLDPYDSPDAYRRNRRIEMRLTDK